jgi:hypothetical protein
MRIPTSFAAVLCVALMTASVRSADEPAKTKLSKPPTVLREDWGSKPKPIGDDHKHTPKQITIHHAGVDWKTGRDPAEVVRAVQKYGQEQKNWPDLPYHFMIAPDGKIFEARPLEYEPESNTKYELKGHIGIELMGNFETQRPSEIQVKRCVALVAWLCQEYKIDPSQIAGHRDRAEKQTVCPGKDFYRYLQDGQFVGWVRQKLAGEKPDIKLGEPLKGGPTVVVDTPVPLKGL